MKHYFFLLAIVACTFSCKKDKSDKPARDYSAVVTGSVWTGEFNYPDKPKQPMTISFSDGGQATWHELRGATNGTWKLEGNLLTVNLISGSGFSARIAEDNSLTEIQNLQFDGFTLTSASLNTVPDQVLDGTNWTGKSIAMHFKAGNKVDMELGPTGYYKYKDVTYTRIAKSISFNASTAYKWFIVVSGVATLKGSNVFSPDPKVYTYEMSRL